MWVHLDENASGPVATTVPAPGGIHAMLFNMLTKTTHTLHEAWLVNVQWGRKPWASLPAAHE